MAIIKITNDGKGKSQSFEAELIVPRVDKIISSGEWVDDLNVCSLIQYGATEQEALEALGNNLNYIVEEILKIENVTERAIEFMLYGMRKQLFWDGNKRTSTISANKIMIENGCGIIKVPDDHLEEFNKYWPCDIHLIGKDILRFHTIYWPIMLHALGLDMPKKIFGHPWLLFGNDKMSKSKGNIVYADDLVNVYGVDAIRYYLIHEMPFSNDGTFTMELLINSINTNLANTLGNLVNRTIGMANKYFDGVITNKNIKDCVDDDLIKLVSNTKLLVEDRMDNLRVADAIDSVFEIFRRCNKYIDETMPWVLAKEEDKKDRLNTVLYNLVESIRIGAVLLQPFMPDTANEIFKQLNTDLNSYDSIDCFGKYPSGNKLGEAKVLFQRIDTK